VTCLTAFCAVLSLAHGVRVEAEVRLHDASSARTEEDSASRARQGDFDARGRVRCAQERGQAPGECEAAVARDTDGKASVVVTFPNGFSRTLFFARGEFVSASATMSGSGTDTDQRIEDELHLVRVDDQRYELPDVFVFGE